MLKAQKKLVGLVGIFGVVVSILTVFLLSHPVAADTYAPDSSGNCKSSADTKTTNSAGVAVCQTPANTTPGAGQAGQANGQASTDNATTCAIEKMGWILCPLIETAGKVGDQAFEQLAKHFLETEPELVASVNGGNKPGTYVAWELARNIANIMFIIAFLIIIFSQVTGRGIDNYGIKKLLPKLIVAAIAVNVSYYICQAIVDLTNIMGYSIENFMVETAKNVSSRVAMPPQTSIDIQTSHGTLGTIALGVLGAAAIVWFLLPILFLGISTVVIACLVIVVILLMRKAFIVLLVVASPIAFVFYLLPNTERLFQKWLKMFWQLLLVFPIVGMLFGGGQLASAIILVAGTTSTTGPTAGSKSVYSDGGTKCIQLPSWPDDNQQAPANGGPVQQTEDTGAKVGDCGTKSTPFMLGLVAAGVAVAPLFAVWAVLKGALSAAGTLGGKISGAIQNAGNGANKYARKPEDALRKMAFNAGRDHAKNYAITKTLGGSFGEKPAKFLRRRQTAQARRAATRALAESEFDASPLGSDDFNKLQAVNQGKAALDTAAREKFVQAQLNNPNMISGTMGRMAGDENVAKALSAQQTNALAAAVKELEVTIQPNDLDAMEEGFRNALQTGNKVAERAYANALFGAGSPGQQRFINTIGDGQGFAPGMIDDVKENMVANNSRVMSEDLALKAWGTQTENNDLSSFRNNASTYETSVEKFTAQSKQAQIHGAQTMSQAARDELRDALLRSPEIRNRVDKAAQTHLGL